MVHFLSDLFIYFSAAVVAAAVAFFGALTLARLGFPGRGGLVGPHFFEN